MRAHSPATQAAAVALISTAQQHLAAGLQVISNFSAHPASHQHVVNLEAVAANGDVELDHNWRRTQTCRECGAPGGGITVSMP